MTIEKRGGKAGETGETDVRALLKQADAEEEIIVVSMDAHFGKEAVAVVATGKRARQLRKLLEAE